MRKFGVLEKSGYNPSAMTDPKDPNSPPIPVPETMEEARAMAREAMAVAARTSANLDKLGAKIDKIAVISGRHEENTGRILEKEFAAQVARDGKIAWMSADEVYSNMERVINGRPVCECDLIVANGAEVMLVEVKRVLRAEDVRRFSGGKLARFRDYFPAISRGRVIYGAMAFALEEKNLDARAKTEKLARDAGIMLIRMTGKSGLQVLNPERENLQKVQA